MASISHDKATGRRTIQFVAADGKRKSIRLGKVNKRQAEAAKLRIEDLIACRSLGTAPQATTAEWIAEAPETIRRRLERVGLIGRRERAEMPTLGAWLERYITGRKDVKPRTLSNYEQARTSLLAFFGDGRPLDEINNGEAEDFRVWLRTEKNLSEGTTRRRCKRCKQFFAAAVKRRIIAENPFDGIKCSNFSEDRFYFVSREEAAAVLDACPDARWRVLFALARFGGLRVPSEIEPLEWRDVNWEKSRFTVRSHKTEHHDGKGSRVVPIFPELYPHLQAAFDAAEPGARYVVDMSRDRSGNLRTQLRRIIERAGLVIWPKLFQNLRSTRETELAEAFPIHVVTAWLGNSPEIAQKHYLQVHEGHYDRAAEAVQNPVQFPVQQASAGVGNESQDETPEAVSVGSCETIQNNATHCNSRGLQGIPPRGLEPLSPG